MNDDDGKLMQTLGITLSRKNVYAYTDFRYEWFDDAIRYAEIDARREAPKSENNV
jgi:hypothetical protein